MQPLLDSDPRFFGEIAVLDRLQVDISRPPLATDDETAMPRIESAWFYILANGALINVQADVAPDVAIGALACIDECTIGPDCVVNSRAQVRYGAQLGRSVEVGAGALIWGGCVIGDNVIIGVGATVGAYARIEEETDLPDYTVVMYRTHVDPDDVSGYDVNPKREFQPVVFTSWPVTVVPS